MEKINFITTVTVQPFEKTYSLKIIDFLAEILPSFDITVIDITYGWAWEIEIVDWGSRTIAINSLKAEIEKLESQGFGKIGEDDISIKIDSHNLEITLCHETDLHIKYEILTPLVEKILEFASSAFSTIRKEENPYSSSVFFSEKPNFLVSYDSNFIDSKLKTIILEPSGKTLECSPKESLQILGYSSISGLLKVEQDDATINVKGWNSSNIQIHCDKQLIFDTKTTC